MKRGYLIIITVILLLLVPQAIAVHKTGQIKLLAVYQEDGEFKGSPADVELEIKSGTGRVFLETIPLSKMDTQISTRFAKEIACKFSDNDCNEYDFFYTIKSTAGLVGGPSAGGAISALTVAMLNDLQVSPDVAMTGTINSGELIGPVGSVEEKIDAAKEAGIKKVLIPGVQSTGQGNNSLIQYGEEIGVEVIPVNTLSEALEQITGKEFKDDERDVDVPETYTAVMEDVARRLCARTDKLMQEADIFNLTDKKTIDFEIVNIQKQAQNMTERGKRAFENGNTYSAASYCFGASVQMQTLLYKIMNLTEEEREQEHSKLQQRIEKFNDEIESKPKETITDLQTYMIVKERILEAKQYLATGNNNSESYGYVSERLNSAVAWSEFFGKGGQAYNIDEKSLEGSCAEILGEADERFQYLNLFFPGILDSIRNNLLAARDHYNDGEYALCIYLASRTKAEANIMVSMLGVREEVVDAILEQKINASKRAVTKQIDEGVFPIIAYSYYEYARSLKEDNNFAALLYAEYALELSDIDIYFEKKKISAEFDFKNLRDFAATAIFIWGLILGFLLCWIILREKRKSPGKRRTNLRLR
ncbi:hypothetical protein HQ545_01960 [Candidatus Woesearchaeota archaeon]|nr:hypothetical protein [Candidatus Woesearchaeota archaeon]